ncbi:MFS transporter [Corynebacterium sp.]|uniref:MFS transporter n=1 Tax=Corynebacterium sp. TaxID=1720 RepID=UPI0026DC253B|nr:MFS transporter [Corynebacterium sp.]MDO4915554.1 hypothetical protein [Corynebacterium sp.]
MEVAVFAIPLIAIEMFHATPMQVACLNLMESAAALIFGLVVAESIDRLPGFKTIPAANFLRLIACISVAVFLFTRPSFSSLFICLFILGVSSLINEAGVNSTVVSVVGRSTTSLNRVNSLLRSSGVMSELGGIALGGGALTLLTFAGTMTIGALSFGLALILSLYLWRLLNCRKRDNEALSSTQESSAVSTREESQRSSLSGLKYIFGNDFLRKLTLTSFHFNFFSSIFQAVFVIFCVRILDFRPWALSVVGVAGAVGGLTAAAAAGTSFCSKNARTLYAMSIGLPALSISLMLFAQYSDSNIARISLVGLGEYIFGSCMVLCIVLFNTARQQCSPDSIVGSIAATERTIALGGEVPGFLLGGVLATVFSLGMSMVVAIIGIILAPVWIFGVKTWPSGDEFIATRIES